MVTLPPAAGLQAALDTTVTQSLLWQGPAHEAPVRAATLNAGRADRRRRRSYRGPGCRYAAIVEAGRPGRIHSGGLDTVVALRRGRLRGSRARRLVGRRPRPAQRAASKKGQGHEQARRTSSARASVEHYRPFLTGDAAAVIVAGDFNNAVFWDRPGRAANFTAQDDAYAELGLASAYHHACGCAYGAEPEATHWWQRNPGQPFHIDYVFVSCPAAVTSVDVGSHEEWGTLSDHAPISVQLDLKQCR